MHILKAFFFLLLPLITISTINIIPLQELNHNPNPNECSANNSTESDGTEMFPLIDAKKVEMMMVMNETRRKLGSFQICAPCTCCGGAHGYCLPSPCCYAINCNIPNRPFGFCSFIPRTCNCFSVSPEHGNLEVQSNLIATTVADVPFIRATTLRAVELVDYDGVADVRHDGVQKIDVVNGHGKRFGPRLYAEPVLRTVEGDVLCRHVSYPQFARSIS
ncbi:hypothetical protein V2J09_000733 [Rumex salicifolius]